ncbi:hypothetical protein LCGC14_1575880, partial [marine sediment metagenome]
MTTKTELTKEEAAGLLAQREEARRDFLCFLDFCYIDEPPQPLVGRSGGKVRFEKWAYILEMAEAISTKHTVIVLKPRQIGFSWITSAYAAWRYTFLPGVKILIISKDEKAAWAYLDKVRFILRNLPDSWPTTTASTDSRSEISSEGEHGIKSSIEALASTKDAGRSYEATLVIQDEAEFHPELNLNHAATRPTIAAGGQIIMGSTANGREPFSFFKGLYKGAPGNGWKKMFFHWSVRPGRTEEWYEAEKASIPPEELGGFSPEEYMEREYPASEAEALR